jgi:hypothetical protein
MLPAGGNLMLPTTPNASSPSPVARYSGLFLTNQQHNFIRADATFHF